MNRHDADPRMVTGWAANDMILPIATYREIAQQNPEAGFCVSGDALTAHSRAQAAKRPVPDPALKRSGRRAADIVSYDEKWAERYHRSQLAIERARLAKGAARHRAHREPVTAAAG